MVIKRALAGTFAAVVLGSVSPQLPTPEPSRLDDAVPAASSDSTCFNYKRKERRFARLMNGERDDSNVRKMSIDPELSRVARKHTREMIGKETLHHTADATLMRRVTNWNVLGENVGVGGSVASLHDAFMNSPAHKDNVLYSSFQHVGVGTKKDSDDRLWVTVIFEARSDPGTTLRMPSCNR